MGVVKFGRATPAVVAIGRSLELAWGIIAVVITAVGQEPNGEMRVARCAHATTRNGVELPWLATGVWFVSFRWADRSSISRKIL